MSSPPRLPVLPVLPVAPRRRTWRDEAREAVTDLAGLERALRLYAATVPRLRRLRAVFAALMERVRARDSVSGGGSAVAASTEVSVSERVAVIDADIARLLDALEDATEKGDDL